MTAALQIAQALILLLVLGVVGSICLLIGLAAWAERQERRELARRRYARDVITAKRIGNRLAQPPTTQLRRIK